MIVLDASAAVGWLLQTPAGQRIENAFMRTTKPSIRPTSSILRSPKYYDVW
jgi:predicted nucleic acid-binding protein